MERYIINISTALEAIATNKLRSGLTALGIFCGVAAVISMMAIGSGAKQEIIEQLNQVGVNNIIIYPVIKDDEARTNEEKNKSGLYSYSPGLTVNDYYALLDILPNIKMASPEISYQTSVLKEGRKMSTMLTGISGEYLTLFNLEIINGSLFNTEQEKKGLAVCIIGGEVKRKLFGADNPVGQNIKCGKEWFKVIGEIENTNYTKVSSNIGISLMDDKIFIPVKTMLLRIRNRSLIRDSKQDSRNSDNNNSDPENTEENSNYNQLDKIIIQVNETNQLESSAKIINRALLRRHQEIDDFEIKIPELLLKQQQKTHDIFNIVLGAIASISLIVGGIGIMNIMFASVSERISEIGIRMAIGANKKDIKVQFLSEAVIISLTGGSIGVISGIIMSKLITGITGITTNITFFSIIISFGVSVAIGIIFGFFPAKKASEKNPIESLRHE